MAKQRKKRKSSKKRTKKFSTNFKKAVSRDIERREQASKSYGYLNLPQGVPVFNPEPKSRVRLDIMPYVVSDPKHPDQYEDEGIAVPGELWYKRPFSVHRNIGVENDSVVCLRSVGKACPICEYRERRMKEGAAYDDDDIKRIKASNRNLYVVIPRKSKEYEEIPHIWDMSQYLFQNLLDEELKEDEDFWTFPDLEDGKTLRIRFDEGKAFGNSFPEASRIDFYDRKKPYDPDILDDIPDLDQVLQILSYDELEAKFLEIDDADLAEDHTEEETTSRRSKSAEPEPEEDEDLEDEFEDEDLEDEFEDEDLEEEEEEPWEDEEEFEDEFEDEEEPWEDEEEWDDEDWDEEFEEAEEPEPEPEPEPKKKPKRTKKSEKRKRKK